MKLSKDTISLLKSFSGINTGVVLDEGSVIHINSEAGDVYVKATVEESFPDNDTDMAIYDVPQFINTLNLFEDPEIDFAEDSGGDGFISISSGKNTCNFYFVDSSFIAHGSWLPLTDTDYILDFELSDDDIQNIQKASNIMSLDQLEFVNEAGKLACNLVERLVTSRNKYAIAFDKIPVEGDFKLIMRVAENFRLYPGNYKIRIADFKGTMIFCAENKDKDISYQVAMDRNSYFSK